MKRNNIQHVTIVDGGFFTIHEYLYETDRLDWLVDHNEKTCPVCDYYHIQHMMKKMKVSVTQTAQNVASNTVSALKKMQENIAKQDTQEIKNSLKDVQDGISSLSEKGKSLFSKALSWTKEKSLSIAEDMNKRSKNNRMNYLLYSCCCSERERTTRTTRTTTATEESFFSIIYS